METMSCRTDCGQNGRTGSWTRGVTFLDGSLFLVWGSCLPPCPIPAFSGSRLALSQVQGHPCSLRLLFSHTVFLHAVFTFVYLFCLKTKELKAIQVGLSLLIIANCAKGT